MRRGDAVVSPPSQPSPSEEGRSVAPWRRGRFQGRVRLRGAHLSGPRFCRGMLARPLRFEQRARVPWSIAVVAPFAAVAFTLLACAGLVVWAGAPVGKAYMLLFDGAVGSRFAITETLTRATPLMLTGLAAAVAFRAHFYNIGAEGQLYLGALAAVAVGSAAVT